MILEQGNIEKDENEFMKDYFYGFKPLTKKHGQLAAHFGRALRCALQVQAGLLLVLAAFTLYRPRLLSILCGLAVVAELLALGAVVAVLAASLYQGRLWKQRPRRPMLYWAWWPCWDFLLCCASVAFGALLGHYLWYTSFDPYYQVEHLQTYKDINPAIVPGAQLQDAGAVSFSSTVNIDPSKGGCFVHTGHTYCVAPIVYTGELHSGLGNAPVYGSWDYFAVGVDCCSCPNQDFRCGDWRNPLAQGGLRSLDFRSRAFYKLAVEDWSSTYMKESSHPLFFDWVENPEYQIKSLWLWGAHALALIAVAHFSAVFFFAVLLGQVLQALVRSGVVYPLDTPAPPPGLEAAWAAFLPEALAQHKEEQEQLLRIPISSAPWYAYGAAGPPAGAAPSPAPHPAARQ